MTKPISAIPTDYAQTIAEIKRTIETTQISALQAVSRELIKLYWSENSC
ncbi:MAG TPA: hypothetical protein VJJ83_04180 [Candidatus Babeliales bacterium]|nr:hypothetical protein [Candidatus Babeliales bacterium]